jgi:hypothetical protein
MPMKLEGSCRCGKVSFSCTSHTPVPYQRCYCSICRKTNGGGGYAINLGAVSSTLSFEDGDNLIRVFHASIEQEDGSCELSTAERRFCSRCGAALWLYSPEWPELIHPFASAIDSELPRPASSVHMMLRFKPKWVTPQFRKGDQKFQLYPKASLADWHRAHRVWVD